MCSHPKLVKYDEAFEKMQQLFNVTKNLRILCFIGRDLVDDRKPTLYDNIENYLKNSKNTKIELLILRPSSKFVEERANEIRRKPKTLRNYIKATIHQFKDFRKKYKNRVSIWCYDMLPIFRIYNFGEKMIVGFYTKKRSYDNYFLELEKNTLLYYAFEKFYEYVKNNMKVKCWRIPKVSL